MKLDAQPFVAELILKQSFPAFALSWLRLWERTELLRWNLKFQVFTTPGAFFKLGGLVWFYPGPLSTAMIKSTDRSCNVKCMCNVSIQLNIL